MTKIGVCCSFFNKVLNKVSKGIIQQKKYFCTLNAENEIKFQKLKVRNLVEEDIPQIIQMRRKDGFQDAVSCYSIYSKLFPEAFIVVDDGEGKVVGLLSGVNNNESLNTIGFRIVHDDYRQLGITSRLTFPVCKTVAGHRSMIGHAKKHLYDYNIKRLRYFERNFAIFKYAFMQAVNPDNLSSFVPENVNIIEFDESHWTSLLAYDEEVVGYKRESIVTLSCHNKFHKTMVALRDGKCVGYGTLKLNIQDCAKLGPLFADGPEIATALLKKLLTSFDLAKGLVGETFSNNSEGIRLMESVCGKHDAITYRFYYKETDISSNQGNIYALSDLELEPY